MSNFAIDSGKKGTFKFLIRAGSSALYLFKLCDIDSSVGTCLCSGVTSFMDDPEIETLIR